MSMETENETGAVRETKQGKGKGPARAANPQLPVTQTAFEISLGSKGSKASWNKVVSVDTGKFSPETNAWLLELGIAYVVRGAVGKDTVDPVIAEQEAKARIAELEAGITAKRRTAATSIERKAREIALEQVRFAIQKQGKTVKSEDLPRIVDAHYEKNREALDAKAFAMLEEAKRQAESMEVEIEF